MWSDTIYLAERAHLARLLTWGIGSVLAGTVLILLLVLTRRHSSLLRGFGVATASVGALQVAIALVGLRQLQFRDLAAFTRFDRMLWLNVGLDVGYLAVGMTLAACGWAFRRSHGLMGAGTAVVAQGLALLVLHGMALAVLSRLVAGP